MPRAERATGPRASGGGGREAADFCLASASPRRRELLAQLGYRFRVLPVAIEEVPGPREPGAEYVCRMAREKARAARVRLEAAALPVLGADTEVVIGARILGKPGSLAEATAMLAALSGRVHRVLSAVAVNDGHRERVVLSSTRVRFRRLEPAEMQAYWGSGEPRDKAGAYAIQGYGAEFVERIEGSYSGVVGLPLCETAALLAEFGVRGWQRDYAAVS